ncbi:Hint domain-containing protein [Acetobacter oryzoeni]|nr:Hint domain-containing protein [Acetobacter oryzoeni]MCP1201843.1 Hint domain-containing protein [Acetobacter oryzoeni]
MTNTSSGYVWVGPATNGAWADASNWQYNGQPATSAPSANTTITIPAGASVTIPADVTSLSSVNIDVLGTLTIASSSTALSFNTLTVEKGGTALVERPLALDTGLAVNNGGTTTFEGVTQDWTSPSLQFTSQPQGTINIDKSNIVMGSVNGSGGQGTLNITGGSVVSTAGNSTNMSGPINVTGSSFTDNSSLASTTILTLNDGATATLSSSAYPADGSTVVFGTGNNTLVLPNLQWGANKVNIENLKDGDRLGVDGTQVTTATLSANNVALTTTSGTPIQVKSVTYDSSYKDAPTQGETQTITIDSGQGVICFLAGSMIATPNGVVAVENIRRGDEVLTFVNGVTHVRPVVWAGMAQATVNPALPDDMAGYPVRILADAIAPGVPYQDLLVTAEHGIFANGMLVPARMLVNGSSIFFDRSITAYAYYHVETAEHSIIMANGMLTESYLDTGNRRNFVSDGNVVTIGAKAKNWAEHAAVPLGTARHVVEPIWRVLAARAAQVAGHNAAPAKPDITHSHGLHLVTAAGTVIRPLRAMGRNISFMLPAGVESVRLVSRASRPCDVEGPFVDKRRMLGVLLGRVTVLSAGKAVDITAHLAEEDGAHGWQDMPQPTTRWTDGNAILPLGATTARGPALLTVEVLQAGPYLATPAAFTLPLAANG